MSYLWVYAVVVIGFVFLFEFKKKNSDERFLVASRSVGAEVGALSIAASWVWAPAIFVSTQVGYQWGYSALVWFVVPNMLALMFFGWFMPKIKRKIPAGYSYIDALRGDSGYFREVQLGVQIVMQIVIFALQLTAGAELLAFVTGASYKYTVLMMTVLPLAYSYFSGLHSSILTDALQYVFMAAAAVLLLLFFPYGEMIGLGKLSHFDPFNVDILKKFGVASAVGLFFAIFADHQQWQRLFSVRAGEERKTFMLAGGLHFVITAALGTLGVLIAQYGFVASNAQLVGADFIAAYMLPVFTFLFVFMALSGLCSTIDSAFCAFGSLCATELFSGRDKVGLSRKSMLLLALFGVSLAFFRLPIIVLWFLASTIRLSAFPATFLSVMLKDYDGRVGSVSILLGMLGGGAIFVCGVLAEDAWLRTIGMLSAFLGAFVVYGLLHLCCVQSRFRGGLRVK